jgi:hypothetical protein
MTNFSINNRGDGHKKFKRLQNHIHGPAYLNKARAYQ